MFQIQASKYVESIIFKEGEKDYFISLVDICDEQTERTTTISLRDGDEFEIIALPEENTVYRGNSYTIVWDKWIMFHLRKKEA